ncbi:MAG: phosphoribosyltransferase [Acidobacteria bacterium]|nr:phosphoribosyltransferase [Acidobacteriota bacterium]
MPFKDRAEAGERLASHLEKYRHDEPVVLGLPRGGVLVAAPIARHLKCEMDVLVSKKLGAPHSPELAIGAVLEDGTAHLNQDVIDQLGISTDYIEREKESKAREARARVAAYRRVKPRVHLQGRTCILVDDGLATGATMIAAIRGVKSAGARRVVVAVPGGPPESLAEIRCLPEVNDVICLETPAFFSAVSQLYQEFPQTTDEEVVEILQEFQAWQARSR